MLSGAPLQLLGLEGFPGCPGQTRAGPARTPAPETECVAGLNRPRRRAVLEDADRWAAAPATPMTATATSAAIPAASANGRKAACAEPLTARATPTAAARSACAACTACTAITGRKRAVGDFDLVRGQQKHRERPAPTVAAVARAPGATPPTTAAPAAAGSVNYEDRTNTTCGPTAAPTS